MTRRTGCIFRRSRRAGNAFTLAAIRESNFLHFIRVLLVLVFPSFSTNSSPNSNLFLLLVPSPVIGAMRQYCESLREQNESETKV